MREGRFTLRGSSPMYEPSLHTGVECSLDALTPPSSVEAIDRAKFDADGAPKGSPSELIRLLGTSSLQALSHMIRVDDGKSPGSPSWVGVYRDLVE